MWRYRKKVKSVVLACVLPLAFVVIAPRQVGSTQQRVNNVKISAVVDNRSLSEDLKTSWGFACVIRGFEKTILFDTGKDGDTLLSNLTKLHIDPKEIDVVVLSHAHRDHTGGLHAFLKTNPKVTVYALSSFPKGLKEEIRSFGATLVETRTPTEILPNVHTTGPLGTTPSEQSLILETKQGLAVLTGCAHPGITRIVKQAKKQLNQSEILFVIGGFHLLRSTKLSQIVTSIQKEGVRYVGPAHCTGKRAIRHFRKTFGDHFVKTGAGLRVVIPHKKDTACGSALCISVP